MRRMLGVGLVGFCLGWSPGGLAADLGAPTRAPVAGVPTYSWTGIYAGLNAGYGWGTSTTDVSLGGVAVFSDRIKLDGFNGGGQVGANWQTGGVVLGIEADIQASGEKGSSTTTVGLMTLTTEVKNTYFGTVRGRAGFTPVPTMYLYGTGGFLYGQAEATATATVLGIPATTTEKRTYTGWTAGAGLESVITGNWTWKLEYLYLRPRDESETVAGLTSTTKTHGNVVRVGFNGRF